MRQQIVMSALLVIQRPARLQKTNTGSRSMNKHDWFASVLVIAICVIFFYVGQSSAILIVDGRNPVQAGYVETHSWWDCRYGVHAGDCLMFVKK